MGEYVAEVEVEVIDDEPGVDGWGPYLSPNEARKLDDVRQALRRGDLKSASRHGRVYKLTLMEV